MLGSGTGVVKAEEHRFGALKSLPKALTRNREALECLPREAQGAEVVKPAKPAGSP
jgi:hypothetical protein